jgi:peptide/nickel transport system permease protein
MGRFLLRRLLWAIPTLLGITVITFALIHLAPGDPTVTGDYAESRRDAEATRRLYFLDLPLFVNGDPRGVSARAERLIQRYLQARDRDRALRELRRCGTACLLELVDAHAAAPAAVERVLVALRDDHPALGDRTLSPVDWARGALRKIAPDRVREAVAGLGRRDGAGERVRALGTAALPAVMEVVLDGHGEPRRAASRVASEITGIEGRLSKDPERSAATLERWSEWWYQHRRDHARFSWWDRMSGRITETQFGKWLGRVVTLRFGHSIHDGRPVGEKLGEALPVTLLLSLLSMALAYLIAVPLGVHAAVRRGSLAERVTTVILFVLYSLPSFWVAMVLILLFGGVGLLDWFPIHGLASEGLEEAAGWTWLADRAHHLVLPVACLTYGSLAVISRYQRTAMLEVIRQDYIRTARAKGLGERAVIFRHALRNSLLPVITLMGLQFPYLISGSVIIERIFNIPGMGMLTFDAFLNRDYPVIIAVAVLSAVLTLLGLILSDLAYALVDPRIQLEERS